jgi:hypothetical protein
MNIKHMHAKYIYHEKTGSLEKTIFSVLHACIRIMYVYISKYVT